MPFFAFFDDDLLAKVWGLRGQEEALAKQADATWAAASPIPMPMPLRCLGQFDGTSLFNYLDPPVGADLGTSAGTAEEEDGAVDHGGRRRRRGQVVVQQEE